jgi:hypothetical protein
MLPLGLGFEMSTDGLQHERQRERAVHEQVPVSLDLPSVVAVEVDQVSIEGQGGIAKQERARGRESVGEVAPGGSYS